MQPKEGSLTLRQRFESQRQSASTPPQSKPHEDAMLRALLGREVTVKFQSGDAVTAVFTALDRFTIKLGGDMVVFKHAIQSVRLAAPVVSPKASAVPSASAGKGDAAN